MSCHRLWMLCACSFALFAFSSPAIAQEEEALPQLDQLDDQRQRELASLIDLAEANSERGEHEKALTYFAEAYAIFPHPQLLYRMAIHQEQLGKLDEAIEGYETFSERMPDASEAPSARRKALELKEKKRLERDIRENADTSLRVFSYPPGAKVYLNDTASRIKGATPTVELPMRPGKHVIILKLEGYLDVREEVTIEPGDKVIKKYTLKVDPHAQQDDDARVGNGPRPGPLIMLGMGVAGTAGALTFGLLNRSATQNKNDYTQEQYEAYTRRNTTLAYVSGGVAVLGFTGALVLWLAGDNKKRADHQPGLRLPVGEGRARGLIAPWWTPDGEKGMGLEVRF